jgi:hypothetical protein
MNNDLAFRLSRIQAEGWKAVSRIPSSELAEISDAAISAINPYSNESERTRWNAGFTGALKALERK